MHVLDYFEQLANLPRQRANHLSMIELPPSIQQAIRANDQNRLKNLLSCRLGENNDEPQASELAFADMQRVYS